MPSRGTLDLAVRDTGERLDAPQILVITLPQLSHQVAMYDRYLPANNTLGT